MKPINRYLDHAVLKPEMSTAEAEEAIRLGLKYEVRTVCVRPCDIDLAREMVAGTSTEVCVVLGFPHGCGLSVCKAAEAEAYIARGVQEIDMVANYGRILSADWKAVGDDIEAVLGVTRPADTLLKVIFETSMLDLDAIRKTTRICADLGADYVKTSTGFNGAGANEEVVGAMLEAAEGRIRVKPSGGIRNYAQARRFVDMGAHRLGVGSGSTAVICEGTQPETESGNAY